MAYPTPIAGASYPSIEDVFQSTRIHINDLRDGATSMVGESRVPADPWTPSINYLNLALRDMQRFLSDRGLPTTREVTFIINGLAAVPGAPDPTLQTYLGFDGYFNGVALGTGQKLPADLLVPIRIGQRITGSGLQFAEVPQAQDDLQAVNQGYFLGEWTWRTDRIYFNGSQNIMDIQLVYQGGVPKFSINLNPDNWATTLIPFLDCDSALAYKVALYFVAPRAAQYPPDAVEYLETSFKSEAIMLVNRWMKTRQRSPASRAAFGDDGGAGASGGGWGSGF